tara:strand:+ start:908 stop:1573 length:666 start_codon:yes stop_codon:yes gene_type:complete
VIRSELKTLALALLNEKGTYFSANIDALCDMANRLVYRAVAQHDPSHFAEYTLFAFPANTEFVDLTGGSYLDSTPVRVLGVDQLGDSLTVDSENSATPLTHFDIGMHRDSVTPYYGTVVARWAIDQGWKLHLSPIQGSAVNVRVRWIDKVPDMESASDSLLADKAHDYHDMVVATLQRLLHMVERRESYSSTEFYQWISSEIQMSAGERDNDYTFPVADLY